MIDQEIQNQDPEKHNTVSSQQDIILSVQNLGVCYRPDRNIFNRKKEAYWALKNISFNLYRGEKLGIIGRNGCGKSTLMKTLTGIYEADKGRVKVKKNTHIQLLSLGVGFERSLSGRENAVLSGMLLGKSRKDILDQIESIKEFSELGDFFEQPVKTYSSGMVSRLGFAVAIVVDPDILLLDEILSVGDAHFAEKSQRAIREKFSDNKTIILISHDPYTIINMCERAIWIENGEIRAEGDVYEVSERYIEAITPQNLETYRRTVKAIRNQ